MMLVVLGLRRSSSFLLFCLCLDLYMHLLQAAPDFTGYVHKLLKNHTAQACDGETLIVSCPSKTALVILSASYGSHASGDVVCPGTDKNRTEEKADCVSFAAVQQKVMYKCQDRPACKIHVISDAFGPEPCPGTSKVFTVSYKCRPEYHRSKMVCENERLRLACMNSTVLAIYSATFGHLLHGSPHCPQNNNTASDMECLSPSAMRRVSRRCHGKMNCSVLADTHNFGDPCFPGIRKRLRVSYTCVPRNLLEDWEHGPPDSFSMTDTHGFPEAVALYFASGICAGLVFLLCLFGLKLTLVRDVKDLFSEMEDDIRGTQSSELVGDFNNGISSESSFHRLTRSYRVASMFSPERMVEQEEEEEEGKKEQPQVDIWLHGDSSPMSSTRSIHLNRGPDSNKETEVTP